MQKVLSFILAAVMLLSVCVIAAADDSDWYDENGKTIVRVSISADPGTLDPYDPGSIGGKNMTTNICLWETLAVSSLQGGYDMVIAESYKLNEELTNDERPVYDITIRQGVHDSAGNPINADDIIYSIDTILAKKAGYNLKALGIYEKVDDFTIRFTMKNNSVGEIEKCLTGIRVVSQKAYEEAGRSMTLNPVATGPYKVTKYVTGSELVMEKVENYWGAEQGVHSATNDQNVDIIDFLVIREGAQATVGLETGTVDIVGSMNSTEVERFLPGGELEADFTVFEMESTMANVMFFNCSTASPFNNEDLRKAVMYAIDINGIIFGTVDGLGVPLVAFAKKDSTGYNPEWETNYPYSYDPAKAQELVKSSGYSGQKVRIMSNNSDTMQNWAQILQQYLLAVGIDSELLPYEDALFSTYRYDNLQWDIILDNTGVGNTLLAPMWVNKYDLRNFETGMNAMCMNDPEFQAMVESMSDYRFATQDAIDAVHYYVTDHAIAIGVFSPLVQTVARSSKVVDMYHTGTVVPQRVIYAWN